MHAFDDEVSYTRIIDPEPAGDDLLVPAKGERPSLVWIVRLVATPLATAAWTSR